MLFTVRNSEKDIETSNNLNHKIWVKYYQLPKKSINRKSIEK
jgi:hypothetical protein